MKKITQNIIYFVLLLIIVLNTTEQITNAAAGQISNTVFSCPRECKNCTDIEYIDGTDPTTDSNGNLVCKEDYTKVENINGKGFTCCCLPPPLTPPPTPTPIKCEDTYPGTEEDKVCPRYNDTCTGGKTCQYIDAACKCAPPPTPPGPTGF